jgi:pimeloyl-ACP methyl ester carboxylesterase
MMKIAPFVESQLSKNQSRDQDRNMRNTFISTHLWKLVPILFLITILIPGCKSTKKAPIEIPANANSGEIINMEACVYKAGDVEYTADCGLLIVPENRNAPNSRLISLPVTRIRSTGSSPVEAIFFLPGGPGLPNSGTSRVNWFVDKYDIVIVGYRGVDGSVRLDCPEVSRHIKNLPGDMLGEASIKSMTGAYAHCADRLQNEGVDIAGYTVVEVIDDLEAARVTLGYEKINVFSVSYGTRLAMIYAWRYPESIRRSAMVAVNPPGRMFYYDPKVIDQQLEYYVNLCAQDPKCSAQTADLAETMRTVSHSMPKRWLGIPLDRGMLRAASFESLSDTKSAAKVFDVWLAAAKGDYSGMAMLSLAGPMMFADATVWGENIAKAASADFEATHEMRAEMRLSESILGSPRSEMAAAAAGWPVNTIPEEYLEVQLSDVETLLVSGSIDPWTPAQYAEDEFLPSLSNGQHVVVAENGHAEMLWRQPGASARLLTSFFDTGEADDSLFTFQPWEYSPGLGFPAIAKIFAGGIFLVIAIVGFVMQKVIKKRMRSSK